MHLFNKKLRIASNDLPEDREDLIEGIRQIAATSVLSLRAHPLLQDINLTPHEFTLLNFLATKMEVTACAQIVPQSLSTFLYRLRRKMKLIDIDLPRKNMKINEKDQNRFQQIISDVDILNRNSDIAKILAFNPTRFQEDKLPAAVSELQELTARLLTCIRGNIGDIDLPGVETNYRKIILGSIWAQKYCAASTECILLAVDTPFADDPTFLGTIRSIICQMNADMRASGVVISNKSEVGYYLDESSRRNLAPYIKTPEPMPTRSELPYGSTSLHALGQTPR